MASDLRQWQIAISILTVPLYFLVVFALYRRNLSRSYRFLTLYLILEGVAIATNLYLEDKKRIADTIRVYLWVHPPIFVLYIGMVIELFQKLFARYPGIALLARRVVIGSMLVAFLISLASLGGDLSTGWTGQSLISKYSVILRALSSAITLFLLLLTAFLYWMPVPLPPNVIRHSLIFFLYFLVNAFVQYQLNITRQRYLDLVNLCLSAGTAIALFAWFILLKPQGELAPSANAPRTPSGVLLDRLDALNRSLSRPPE